MSPFAPFFLGFAGLAAAAGLLIFVAAALSVRGDLHRIYAPGPRWRIPLGPVRLGTAVWLYFLATAGAGGWGIWTIFQIFFR